MKNILKAIYEEMDDMAMMVNVPITKEGYVNVLYAKPYLFRNCEFNAEPLEVKKYG